MNNDSQLLKEAYVSACGQIKNYIENGVDDNEEAHASLLTSTIRAYISAKNGETAKDTLKFAVNRTITTNPNEFKALVQKSLPEYIGV